MKMARLSQFVLTGCLVVSGSLLGVACNESAPGSPTLPATTSATLAIGQTVAIPDTSLSVTFNGVPNDSRCPSDVVCIQLGDALVALDATTASGSGHLELRTSDTGKVAQVDGHRIELMTLLPYPSVRHPIDPSEYRATLQVTSANR